jgi:hypothetical protein
VIVELQTLAERWRDIRRSLDGPWTSHEARKWLQCLGWYPNEYWRYVVSVYFFRPGGEQKLAEEFPHLLRMLTAWLYGKFVVAPTVNAIKLPSFNLMKSLIDGGPIKAPEPLADDIAGHVGKAYDSRVAGGLLFLHACLHENQAGLVPGDPHIEHIFPRRWQDTNYNGWSKKDAEEHLERFGNKVVFEKRLNILAGNNYFGQKKKRYLESKIADVQDLAR